MNTPTPETDAFDCDELAKQLELAQSERKQRMKTVEEWKDELVLVSDDSAPESVMEIVKQIQLDAMKEGMRRAGLMCDEEFYEHNECRKTILSAVEQLTEKDL